MRGIPRPYTVSLDKPYEKAGESDNRRSMGRFRVKDIHASQGGQDADVLDISGTGMRVRIKGKFTLAQNDQITVTVQADDSSVQVEAIVVWIKELGRKDHEVGLHFHELNAQDAQTIRRMAIDASRSMIRGG